MIIDVSNTLGRHRFKPEIKAGDLLKDRMPCSAIPA